MKADQFKELLARYAAGTANDKDRKIIDSWYDSYDDDTALTEFQDAGQESMIKAQMQEIIQAKRNTEIFAPKLSLRPYYKYAAIVTLLIPALFFSRSIFKRTDAVKELPDAFDVYLTHYGEYKKLTLPDHSVVHLNPNTTLRISQSFGDRIQRNVYLDQGEAFFEVAKDPAHPFIVHTAKLYTKVLGTKFAVHTQPKGLTEVSVSEGKVEVGNSKTVFDALLPGKKLRYYSNDNHWKVSDFSTNAHNQWFEQVVNLDHATFDELASRMKIIYGVQLRTNAAKTDAYIYNMQIRSSRSLDKTLKIICSIHENKYRRTSNEVVIY
ncbi:FecR family protein [Pedobacter metabolipauper]|uniref:FecR family protein n=1 Tax=Pedobacter metabolipauper TaxID=425513 RepID=A0A4R6SY06_9SPHI|nr:FecR family protein [Pedobacter metabolipauper]TDQ11286.1 FecR family protein [Pedobacter metabolipauper]